MGGVNREKAQRPRGSKWCFCACDRICGWVGRKCPLCGKRIGASRIRMKPNKNNAALLEPLEMSYEDAFAG